MNRFCRKFRYLVLLLGLAAVNSQTQGWITFTWPEILPVHKGYRFLAASQAHVDIPILGVDGKALYRFRCTPDFPSENGTIGALACYLITADSADHGIDSFTLLTEDPMDDMVAHGRGQISSYELEGACATYPEYGSERTFHLRGMELTLRMKEVEFASTPNPRSPARVVSGIHAFGLEIAVTPDKRAVSAIAEPVPYAPPRPKDPLDPWNAVPDCSTLIPDHVLGNLADGFAERQGLSGPFPEFTGTEEALLLDASKMQGHDFAFPGYPMPPAARMVSFPVLSPEGNHVYDFACSGYVTGGRFERYGIVCGLFLPGKDFNLLADGVDPYSRMNPSEILPGQIYGDCGGYPGWGRKRVFLLRGMRLTLRLSNAVFVTGDFGDRALASVRLRVQAEPDPSATSPVAAPPTTIYWGVSRGPHPCRSVLFASSQASR